MSDPTLSYTIDEFVYRAWGLPAMDQKSVVTKGGIDAYCQVNFGGNKPMRTKWHTVKLKGKPDRTAGDLRVEWHEEMVLPVSMNSTAKPFITLLM